MKKARIQGGPDTTRETVSAKDQKRKRKKNKREKRAQDEESREEASEESVHCKKESYNEG